MLAAMKLVGDAGHSGHRDRGELGAHSGVVQVDVCRGESLRRICRRSVRPQARRRRSVFSSGRSSRSPPGWCTRIRSSSRRVRAWASARRAIFRRRSR
jgi:hypothetical protein